MKLAFYRADCDTADGMDKFIAWGTQGIHSHVEGVFSDGKWFSISPREPGPRFKRIEPKPGHWDFINIPMSLEAEQRIRKQCVAMKQLDYAWVQAFFSATPFCIGFPNKMFCSKLWVNLIQSEGYTIGKPCNYSPSKLYRALQGL